MSSCLLSCKVMVQRNFRKTRRHSNQLSVAGSRKTALVVSANARSTDTRRKNQLYRLVVIRQRTLVRRSQCAVQQIADDVRRQLEETESMLLTHAPKQCERFSERLRHLLLDELKVQLAHSDWPSPEAGRANQIAAGRDLFSIKLPRVMSTGVWPREQSFVPTELIHKIFETWKLEMRDRATLLGLEESDQWLASEFLAGKATIAGRDIKDRIAYLILIKSTLYSLFRNEDVENEWLREAHGLLGNRTPLGLLLEGSMENMLLVKEFCDEAGGV